MPSRLRVHAIIIALNEEPFIANTIAPLYEQCSGISVISQYDRNYYGDRVLPDGTINNVLNHPDPEGGLVRCRERLVSRANNHSEKLDYCFTAEQAIKLQSQQADWIPTSQLPVNIRDASWPDGLIDRSEES